MISDLEELREENKSLKKIIDETKGKCLHFLRSPTGHWKLKNSTRRGQKDQRKYWISKEVFGSQHRSTEGRSRNEREDIDISS